MRNSLHRALLAAALRTGHFSSVMASYGNAETIACFFPRTRKLHRNEGKQSHQCSSVWTEGLLPKWQTSTLALQHGRAAPGTAPLRKDWESHTSETMPVFQSGSTAMLGPPGARRHCQLSMMTTLPDSSHQHESQGKDSPGKCSSICCETGDTANCIRVHSCLFLRESQIQNRAFPMF